MRLSTRRQRKWHSAQSLVEFALVGPIFFVMLLGTIEMGRLMWVSHELSNGTREGARWATVRGERSGENITTAQVQDVILDRTSALDGASLTVNVTWSSANRTPGSTVTVATTYVYTPLVGGFLGIGDVTMNRQSQMTIHY
jgi:Flp pilus assembly protein TadG